MELRGAIHLTGSRLYGVRGTLEPRCVLAARSHP